MRARAKLRMARSACEQSQGTAQVGLGDRDAVAGEDLLRWAIESSFSFGSACYTRRQPVPPHKGHCDWAMAREHRLTAAQGASEYGRGKKGNVKNQPTGIETYERLLVNPDHARRRNTHQSISRGLALHGVQTARKLILNEFCESRHLPLHLAHLLAHVQYDFDTGKVDAHLAGEREDHFQAFEVRLRVKAGIAFRS